MNIFLTEQKIMNIFLNEQNWRQKTLSLMPKYVRIIGRVVGEVAIRDLACFVKYNQFFDIAAEAAVQSKDLLDAIDNKWIDIVYGKEYLNNKKAYNSEKQNIVVQQQQPVQTTNQVTNNITQQVNLDDIRNIVEQTALQAAKEATSISLSSIKSLIDDAIKSSNTNDIDTSKMANDIASKLSGKLIVDNKNKDIKESENVFIDLDVKDIEKGARLTKISEIKKEKINVFDSIEKMKQFKKLNGH